MTWRYAASHILSISVVDELPIIAAMMKGKLDAHRAGCPAVFI
jgi:hypothetical protein